MRGKKSKEIRRLARAASAGRPTAEYHRDNHTNSIVLDNKCTRALIKQLKRMYNVYKRG